VVPQVEKLYIDLKKELPFISQVMVVGANFLAQFWWLVIMIAGAGIYFFTQYLKTEAGIKFKDTMKLNVPIFWQDVS